MNLPIEPAGTDPSATKDSILANELKKLQNTRVRIKEENQEYIEKHPELKTLLDEFVGAIIRDKPSDIIKFGAMFFGTLRREGGIGPSPIVIAGPSGVGKGTMIKMLLEKYPNLFGFSISHTTRPPREGEVDGKDYYFVSQEQFDREVADGSFVEYANVHTNMYGTSFKAVEQVRSNGKICILDIDIQGAQNVKKSTMECKYLFIAPPTMEILKQRLKKRGSESEERMAIRLDNAVKEMEYGTAEGNFDAVLVNDDMTVTFDQIVYVLQGWYPDLDIED